MHVPSTHYLPSLSHHIPFLAVYHLQIAQWNFQTQITFELHVVEKQFHQARYLFPRYLTYLKQVDSALMRRNGWHFWLDWNRSKAQKSNAIHGNQILAIYMRSMLVFVVFLVWKIIKLIGEPSTTRIHERKQESYFWVWIWFFSIEIWLNQYLSFSCGIESMKLNALIRKINNMLI